MLSLRRSLYMASVIRAGGSQPLQVTDSKSRIKLAILEQAYDRGLLKGDLIVRTWELKVPTQEEIQAAFTEMIAEGWLVATQFRCTCCKALTDPKEIVEHAIRFQLTPAGYDRIPEHFFP